MNFGPSSAAFPSRKAALCAIAAVGIAFYTTPIDAQRSSPSLSAAAPAAELREATLAGKRPRLTILLSVDQLRGDYLTRFGDQFSVNGGLRRFLRDGAFLADAHYSHIPTATGPGHAVMLSGARPAETGIIGNDWVTSSGKRLYCVEDDRFGPVGIPAGPRRGGAASPLMMRAETLGDVMSASYPGASRTVSLGIKDRAAILMAGRKPDAAVWFDENFGRWITSTYYGTTLPLFAQKANTNRLADTWVKESWDLKLPRDAYNRSHAETVSGMNDGNGMGTTFPLQLSEDGTPGSKYWKRLGASPFGNEMVLELAKSAIIDMDLGRRGNSDLLALNFSSVDYAGHSYGPNSPHIQDMMLRLDTQLGEFMSFLESRMASEDVLIVLTSDHGISPLPEWYGEVTGQDTRRLPGNLITNEAAAAIAPLVADAVAAAQTSGTQLTTTSANALIAGWNNTYLTLHGPRMAEMGLEPKVLRAAIASRLREFDTIEFVATREDILSGQLAGSPYAAHIINGYNLQRSGDVVVIPRPFVQITSYPKGTNHITPYNYDTHVPIAFLGRGIRAGWYHERADVRDIAPTLSAIHGLTAPAQSTGRVLHEILR